MFYEEYSSETFASTVEKYLNSEFVQSLPAQIATTSIAPSTRANVIVQSLRVQNGKTIHVSAHVRSNRSDCKGQKKK